MPSQYKESYLYYAGNKEVKSIQIRGINKRDADQKFREFLIEFNEHRHDTPLFKDFVAEKYRPTFMPKLAPTTQHAYNIYLDRYLIPFLGDKELGEITVEDIQKFYDWMSKPDPEQKRDALVKRTIERISGLGKRIFRIAREMKIIDDTPFMMTLLTIDAAESTHHKALPDEEAVRIKKAVPGLTDPKQRLYMGLLIYTGLRREEIAGMRWENLHLDRHYGEVRQVVVYPNGSNAVLRNKTKTKHSTRDFIIPEALVEILQPLQQESGFVIHGKDPETPAPFSTLRRVFQGAFKELGIYGVYSNHDWRATFGTQLKDSGLTSAQIADLLGHADTRMVETTYAPNRHQSVMKHMNLINAINPYAKNDSEDLKPVSNA